MGRTCTICTLRRRRELERDYVSGVAVSELAGRYQVGRDAIRRHLDQHYMEPVDKPVENDTEIQGLGALEEQLLRDIARLRELAERATREGDLRLAGSLLEKVIQGHAQLLASRDRRIGYHARILSGALRDMGPLDKRTVLESLLQGTLVAGDVSIELPPPPDWLRSKG